MSLADIFDRRSIILNLEGKTKEAVFAELIEAIRVVHPEFDSSELAAAINERENKMSTGIASGIAIPHGYCRSVSAVAGAIGVSQRGIEYGALDSKPVHVVFMLVMGEAARENHLRVLNQVFTLVKSEAFALMRSATDTGEIHNMLSRFH
jgi:mannitol/fructose-specific phosphotransferase system IIA component (Ntr-type)